MSMKKIINRSIILFCFFFALIFIFPFIVKAERESLGEYYQYDYVIENYNVDIVVNDDNSFDIEERISVYFNQARHGIYRDIPLNSEIIREDGTTSKNKARISNLKVNDNYDLETFLGTYTIKIGSEDKTVIGNKEYVISYTYSVGKDSISDYDEFYFNIIGDGWSTVIGNVNFTIKMPKKFDESNIGFSIGKKGSSGYSDLTYRVEDNTIVGQYNKTLFSNEALTIRIELEEGYFANAGFKISPLVYIIIAISIMFLIICLIIWYVYGRDDKVIETVEFYPPNGCNSLDVAFLYKGFAEDKDVVSLLVYLASKGYIKISELEKDSSKENKEIKIIKVKNYDGDNEIERIFFNSLFTKKKTISDIDSLNLDMDGKTSVNEVKLSDLKYKFSKVIALLLNKQNSKTNKDKIFISSINKKKVAMILMAIVTYIAISVVPMLVYGNKWYMSLFICLFPLVGYIVAVLFTFSNRQGNIIINGNAKVASKVVTKIFGLVFGVIFAGIPFGLMILPILLHLSEYLVVFIIGFICIIGMTIAIKFVTKRTKYGTEILGKIKGFKRYLLTAEKSRLEALVEQDPTYFYDILPYAYVLDVSSKWIEKFEGIAIPQPDWYSSVTVFDLYVIDSFLTSTVNAVSLVRLQNSSSGSVSSRGGFSGGGFSGGGFGGGGGGSW